MTRQKSLTKVNVAIKQHENPVIRKKFRTIITSCCSFMAIVVVWDTQNLHWAYTYNSEDPYSCVSYTMKMRSHTEDYLLPTSMFGKIV